jgi:hypothetical protein
MSEPTFVLMGNHAYYPMLDLNIACIRAVYPGAGIIVYDWGDAAFRPAFSASAATVVDWARMIADTAGIEAGMTSAFKVDLALRYNARFRRTLGQRMRKKALKLFGESALTRGIIRQAVRFENMLEQKIPCMIDASARVDAGPMVFLDADAFLVKPIDDVLGRADVAVTLFAKRDFTVNQCSVINSGVIVFGPDRARRSEFLRAWRQACAACHEWLREQTAMVRMLEAAAVDVFAEGAEADFHSAGHAIRLLALPCAVYNNIDHEVREGPRVIHLANTAQNQARWRMLRDQVLRLVEKAKA